MDGVPTGCVRISFGYMSTFEEANYFVQFIKHCFTQPRIVLEMPPLPQHTTKTNGMSESQVWKEFCCYSLKMWELLAALVLMRLGLNFLLHRIYTGAHVCDT